MRFPDLWFFFGNSSRPSLVKAHRQDKPAPAPRKPSALAKFPILPPTLLKSEIKALKNKKKGKKEEEEEVFASDDDEDAPRKKNKDGELVDDLEEDDLAFGSGSSDDDLSVMSELESLSDMSSMDEREELSDLGEIDDSDDEYLSSISGDEEEEEGAVFDDGEELKWDDEADNALMNGDDAEGSESESDEESSGEESSELSESESDASSSALPRKKSRPVPDNDDLEAAYASRPAPAKAPKPRLTKLPTIVNGQAVRATSPLDRSPSLSPEPEPEPEVVKKVPEYRSDPLGQRFGRPAVRQLLEIKDKKERVARAREEIADLGREASGTGEGEGGVSPSCIVIFRVVRYTHQHLAINSSTC